MKKIAEEEDEKSPFKLLEQDITKFLTFDFFIFIFPFFFASGLGK